MLDEERKARKRERDKAAIALWHALHPEKVKAAKDKYRRDNPERVQAARDKWAKANPEKLRASSARARARDPDYHNAATVKWRLNNPEKYKLSSQASMAKIRANNPERLRQNEFKTRLRGYGLTPETYNAMLEAQGGCCAICRSPTPGGKRQWHIDHCSESGTVRALLCNLCNPGLGFFKHDIDLLQRAIDYLKTYQQSR